MTSWTVHVKDGAPVLLVPERFSLGALLLGPVWLLFAGAWIPTMLVPVAIGLAWFTGLCGRDLRRWSLARRGWRAPHVVVAHSEEEALERLLRFHPSLGVGDLKRSAA